MFAYLIGVAAFALGITATIALHEAGHLTAARACGMRVRRYFVGFGPTLWSTRRGATEYGVKAIPFGGFCDIAGMTAQDEITAEEAPHAMVNKPWWQRVIVLSGGVLVNLLLALGILWGVAITSGIPDPRADLAPQIGELSCVSDQAKDGSLTPCSGSGPAALAGLQVGDRIRTLDGVEVTSFSQVRDAVLARPGDTVVLGVERAGELRDVPLSVATVRRLNAQGELVEAGAIGVTNQPLDIIRTYSPLAAVPASGNYLWQMTTDTVAALVRFPAQIPGVAASIFGGERAQDSPMSVVGASRVGGELVERDLWAMFWMMLASLNLFLALFNLIPLPPLDGGHIAVVLYEVLRDALRKARGLTPAGPADYEKLMPLTIGFAAILFSVGALVLIADVVNPVRLFG